MQIHYRSRPARFTTKLKYICFLFGFIAGYLLSSPPTANAAEAALFLSPSSGNFGVGQTFDVKVQIQSGGSPGINASEGTLKFDRNLLSVARVSKDGSIFNLWTLEPAFSNAEGTVKFGGGNPTPYTGGAGLIITVTFRVLAEGTASVNFTNGSALAADGRGTEILKRTSGAQFTLSKAATPTPRPATPTPAATPTPTGKVPEAPKISSKTHPDENQWYSDNSLEFNWELPNDAIEIDALLTQEPTIAAKDLITEKAVKVKRYQNIKDGVWYFHLRFKNLAGWGPVSRYKVMIDTTPPEPFSIEVRQYTNWDNYPILFFESSDGLSGIWLYEVRIGSGDPIPFSREEILHNPYKMPYQAVGKHPVLVKAFDKAGNFTEANTEIVIEPMPVPPPPPTISGVVQKFGVHLLIILAALFAAGWFTASRHLNVRLKKQITELKNVHDKANKIRDKIKTVFDALKEEAEEQIKLLDKKPQLSIAEEKILSKMKEALNLAEEFLEKETEKIKELLNNNKKQ